MENPVVEYVTEQYQVETGELLKTFPTTSDPFEALENTKTNRSQKQTTITNVKDADYVIKHRDAKDDVQNDLFWSSYDVMK